MRMPRGTPARVLLTVALAVTLGGLVGFLARDEGALLDDRARDFLAAYDARRSAGAGAGLPDLDLAAARALVADGWTLADLDRLQRAIANVVAARSAAGRSVAPPDGVAWDLVLARSARAVQGAPAADKSTPAEIAAAPSSSGASGPPPPLDVLLRAPALDGTTTVRTVLRRLRALARTEVRAALPSHDVAASDRLADRLAFGAAPFGLTSTELDAVLGPIDAPPP